MSLIHTCNLCGETIADNVPYVTLNGNGERSAEHWRTGYVGHYHADPAAGCWTRILEAIRLCDAPRLDAIPTATYQSITARRRSTGRPRPRTAPRRANAAARLRTAQSIAPKTG